MVVLALLADYKGVAPVKERQGRVSALSQIAAPVIIEMPRAGPKRARRAAQMGLAMTHG